jgi:nucleotide-binding universal stress UspA family protein
MQTNVSFSRILCAVDFSEPGRAAFQQGLSLAKAHGALLSLVFAVPRSVRFNWRALERIRLMAELRRIASAEGVSLSVSEQQGDPAGIILLHARARKHDVIVIGTHGRSGLERLRFGSVAERVVAGAPCPTLVVRSTEGAGVEDNTFSHILCPVNISPASAIAVEGAMKLLRRGGRKLTLLHVGPLQRARTARMQLQQLALAGADLGGKIHARLAGGPVASGILDVAAELKPDLIVLGMTSRSGVRRWCNSITGRIVRGSTIPVLAIPGEGHFSTQHHYANV